MKKPLSKQQQKAAKLLAEDLPNLEVASKLGKSESTIIRWKRLQPFKEAIEAHQKAAARAQFKQVLETADDDDLVATRKTEGEQLEKIDTLIEKISTLSIDILESCNTEDISPRALPGLIKAFTGLIESRRNGADRITGIEAILDELGKAEEIFSEKISAS